MELLRRSLLLGCMLCGVWMLRLASLEPLVVISPAAEASPARLLESGPTIRSSGPEWERVLREIDALAQGKQPPDLAWRARPGAAASSPRVFFNEDESPVSSVHDELAAAKGTAYLLAARPEGERSYRVDRVVWSRQDFKPGAGFTGQPEPPEALLYPFRMLGLVIMLAGAALFIVIPNPVSGEGSMRVSEMVLLGAVILLFAAPLFAVGGSVQALTRGLWLTLPCWALAAVAMHLFAAPRRHIHIHLFGPDGSEPAELSEAIRQPGFVRIGAALLAVAVGPAFTLVAASLVLWNR